jgi:hypothetical protein
MMLCREREAWWGLWAPAGGLRRWGPVASKVDTHRAGIHPESTSQAAVITWLFTVSGWTPTGVDSQKKRSDASDVARCAPQHTFWPGKEPENNGLAVCLRPARRALAPKKLSPNGFRRAFSLGVRWASAPRQPAPPDPSRPASPLRWLPLWTLAWIPEAAAGVHPKRERESVPFGALSPSCPSDSTILLQMSKEKVLQHSGVVHAFSRAAILVSASCQRRQAVVRSQPSSPLICFHGMRAAPDQTSLRSASSLQMHFCARS